MSVFIFRADQIQINDQAFNARRFRDFQKKNKGRYVRVEFDKLNRTIQQNKLYWKYLGIIENETGNSADDLHEFFKKKFLGLRAIKMFDEDFEVSNSSTALGKLEFGEYMDKISALTNIPIPDTKQYYKKLEEVELL